MTNKNKNNLMYYVYTTIEENGEKWQKYEMVTMKEISRNTYLNKLINRKENGMIKVVTGICNIIPYRRKL